MRKSDDNSEGVRTSSAVSYTHLVDADVVVIGSAVAGSLSAFGALENGAKVVMLERNKIFHYGGNQGSFLNSEFQKQSGKPTYDPKEIVYHIVGNTANRCDIRQWRVWADRSGELVDTLIEKEMCIRDRTRATTRSWRRSCRCAPAKLAPPAPSA